MSTIHQRLKLLVDAPPNAISALVAALDYAETEEIRPICQWIFASTSHEAKAGVIKKIHRLSDSAIDAARTTTTSIAEGVKLAAEERDQQTLFNIVQIIDCRTDPELLDLLVTFIAEGGPAGAFAAKTLLNICVRVVGETGRKRRNTSVRTRLDKALAKALFQCPLELQDDISIAAALLARNAGPALADTLSRPADVPTLTLRRAMARPESRIVRRNLINWLSVDALAPGAARHLERIQESTQVDDLLRDGYLLRAPVRRRAIRRVQRPMACAPAIDVGVHLSDDAQRGLVDYLKSLKLSTKARIEALADCIALTDPIARLLALQALMPLHTPEAIRMMRLYCFDQDPLVARTAFLHLLSRPQFCDTEMLEKLSRSPHKFIRQHAVTRTVRTSVSSFFKHWLDLSKAQRNVAAAMLCKTNKSEMLERLRKILVEGENSSVLLAIELAKRLNVLAKVELELVAVTAARDPHLVSATVSAMKVINSEAVKTVLRRAINHNDLRVRANAVESIAELEGTKALSIIEPILDSRHNRMRANAIRSLIKTIGTESGHLRLMLYDKDEKHRISAIWVAEKSGRKELAKDLMQLAGKDGSKPVRKRARRALAILNS